MWKWLLGTLLLFALFCGGGGYFVAATETGQQLVSQLKPKTPTTEVRVETVSRGDLVRVVSAPGAVEPQTNVEISAQVSARIVALPFREGDQVKRGDVIVRLDSDDLVAALESSKAALRGEEARLEGSRAALAEAEAELGRVRELFDTKDVSKADLDAAEAAYLRALANVKAGEHAVEIAKAEIVRAEKNLEHAVITSPIDGVITRLDAEVGELVVIGTLNNPGSVIMEIADLSTMLVNARVDEANIAPVRAGQSAKVYINAYPDRVFTGRVQRLGLKQQVDTDGTGYFEAEILLDLEDGERLPAGLTANAEIEVQTLTDVVKVPSQAVLDRRIEDLPAPLIDAARAVAGSKAFARVVYVFADGKAQARPVEIGSSDLTHTVVLAGLQPGDRIITGPYRILVDLKHDMACTEQGAPAADAPTVAKAAGEETAKPDGGS